MSGNVENRGGASPLDDINSLLGQLEDLSSKEKNKNQSLKNAHTIGTSQLNTAKNQSPPHITAAQHPSPTGELTAPFQEPRPPPIPTGRKPQASSRMIKKPPPIPTSPKPPLQGKPAPISTPAQPSQAEVETPTQFTQEPPQAEKKRTIPIPSLSALIAAVKSFPSKLRSLPSSLRTTKAAIFARASRSGKDTEKRVEPESKAAARVQSPETKTPSAQEIVANISNKKALVTYDSHNILSQAELVDCKAMSKKEFNGLMSELTRTAQSALETLKEYNTDKSSDQQIGSKNWREAPDLSVVEQFEAKMTLFRNALIQGSEKMSDEQKEIAAMTLFNFMKENQASLRLINQENFYGIMTGVELTQQRSGASPFSTMNQPGKTAFDYLSSAGSFLYPAEDWSDLMEVLRK